MRHTAGALVGWCVLLVTAYPAGVHAQGRGQRQGAQLPPVMVNAQAVTAGDSIDNSGALTTVVGAAQLRDLSALDLASALRRTPGVSIVRFNPIGAFGGGAGGAVFVRGMGTTRPGSEIKTYVDGVPFYLSVWNHPLLDLLPVQGVGGVSVHKGPEPNRYGNSFAAIDIAPRKPTFYGTHGDLSFATGSFGTFVQDASYSMRDDRLELMATQSYMKSDGHRELANGELLNGMLHIGYKLDRRWRLNVTALVADNSASDPGMLDDPGSRTGEFRTSGSLATVSLTHSGRRGESVVKVYQSMGRGDWYDQPGTTGNTLSSFTLNGAQLRGDYTMWRGGKLSAGVDVDRIAGKVDFNPVDPEPWSTLDPPILQIIQPYAMLAQSVRFGNGWSLTPSAGARWYRHSELESATAPHAGVVLRRGGSFALRAYGARGLNYPGVDAIALSALIPALGESWKSLAAEQMDQFEVGGSLNISGRKMQLPGVHSIGVDVSVFNQKSRDRYQFAFPPIATPPAFINLGSYSAKGAEASVHVLFEKGLSTFVSYTATNPKERIVPFTPARQGSAGVVWQSQELRLSVDMQAQDETYAVTSGRAAGDVDHPLVPGFVVMNARAVFGMPVGGQGSELFVSMENVLDRHYEYTPGYPMPGRWVTTGIRFAF